MSVSSEEIEIDGDKLEEIKVFLVEIHFKFLRHSIGFFKTFFVLFTRVVKCDQGYTNFYNFLIISLNHLHVLEKASILSAFLPLSKMCYPSIFIPERGG